MPFSLLLGGISGLAGLFGGGQQQQTNSSSSQQQQSQQSGTSSQNLTNNLSPLQQQLAGLFTNGAINQYNQSTNLQPYEAQGEQQINQNSKLADQVSQNTLASRGLEYSPTAAVTENQNQLSRIGQISQFQNSIPLLQRQLQQQSLSGLVSAFSALPTNRSVTGSSSQSSSSSGTSTGVNTQSGNPTAGLFGGLGAGLAAGANNPYSWNPFG